MQPLFLNIRTGVEFTILIKLNARFLDVYNPNQTYLL